MPSLGPFTTFLPHTLRAKMILGVILPLGVILASLVVVEHKRHQAAALKHLSLLASHSADLIKHEFRHEMLEGDFTRIQESLDTIAESNGFRIIYFLNPAGQVVFAPRGKHKPIQLKNTQPGCQPCHRLPPEDRPKSAVVTTDDGERVFRTMLPIENGPACARCHDSEQRLLGELLTDISMAPLEAPLAASFRINLLWSAGMILIVMLSITFAMNKLVIHRLEGAVQTLKRFAQGERGVRLQLQGPDEIAQLGTAFDEMAQSIEFQDKTNRALAKDLQRQSERRRELLKKVITAQEEERTRVARDLHDELGQGLASITLGLTNFEILLASEPKEAKAQIRKVRSQVTDMIDQMHDIIMDLRPSALDHLGLEPALRTYGEPMLEEVGVKLDVTSELKFRLPVEIEIAVFRTFQEALTNIVRHARAQRATIRLAMRDGLFEGEVADDGQGFEIDQVDPMNSGGKGFGLLGMNERVALCGGELKILSKPGSGTRIQVRIPIPEGTHD